MTNQFEKLEEETRRLLDSHGSSKERRSNKRSIGRTLLAVLVIVIAGWLLLHFLAGLVVWLATVLIVIAAIAAIVWAVRVIF